MIHPIDCAPSAQPKTRKPPRPPQSWTYDPLTSELTITDYDGSPSVYHVLRTRSDCGTAYELISVDRRFGQFRTVHIGDDDADDSCDCPGFCWAGHLGPCKHLTACQELVRRGILPFIEKGGAR